MYFDIIRNYSLNFDKSDPHYILLKKIFKIIDLRKSQTNDHFQGIKNIKKFTNALKILFIKKNLFLNNTPICYSALKPLI